MKSSLRYLFLAGLAIFPGHANSQSSFSVSSPNAQIVANIRMDGRIHYDVLFKGKPLLQNSTLSITIDGKTLGLQPILKAQKKNSVDRWLEPVVKQKYARIRENYNELTLQMEGGYAVTFRVYNEGVAYRFETQLAKEKVTVNTEESVFNFPSNYAVYYPAEESMLSHNERRYIPVALNEIPRPVATMPVVVAAENGVKLALAESGLDDYPGMWFHGTSGNRLAVTFPPYPLKEGPEVDLTVPVTQAADYIAVTTGTRAYPWRLMAVADNDKDLITNQLVWLLEKPSRVEDTSWIHPGKVSWDWWNGIDVYGVDFKAGINTPTYKYFIDFAAKYALPYILIDAGWYKSNNIIDVQPEVDIPELVSYGKQKNVGVLLWVEWKSLDDQLIPALDQYQKWGIKGIKVDFMQRDDQPMVAYLQRVCREAAKRKLLVDFHGLQRGAILTRTWPNLIGNEGVQGLEHDKWADVTDPKHDATLPFTRMFLGPMDYTPGAMHNASKKNFVPIRERPMSQGTRCHQLALYVVFESPLEMLSDSPSNYLREPEAMEFLAAVPSTWDDTRPLDGKIGEYVVVARQKGKEWYVGAITDWTPRTLQIDFSFLPPGSYTMDFYQDGVNADQTASDYKKLGMIVDSKTRLEIKLAPGGGWAARIH